MKDQKAIFQYSDYRDFLADKVKERKAHGKPSSFRWLNERAGFSSPNFLHLVVTKKRHLSVEHVESIAKIFGLRLEEKKFFRALLLFNKAKGLSEREHLARELLKFSKLTEAFPLSGDQYDYYQRWYHIPIRELFNLKSPPKNVEEIQRRIVPRLTEKEIQSALTLLERLDLIKRSASFYRANKKSVETGEKFSSLAVVSYHKEMMRIATESLDRFAGVDREISSVTIGLSRNNFDQVKKLVRDFRSQLMAISDQDLVQDDIYQVNFQVFPLTRKKREA